jgi:HlyD family secretion protein
LLDLDFKFNLNLEFGIGLIPPDLETHGISTMKKPLILLAAIAALTLVAWGAWHYSHRDGDGALVLHGNVDIRQISLAFDGNGRVQELRAEEGDRVKAGALLAVLDTQTLALQAEEAQAQIEVQQQTLLRLRNGSRPQEIAQARSRLLAAQADAVRAEQDLKRLRGISANTQGRGVSVQDMDRAKSAAQVALAQVAEQREALRLAQLALLQHQISLGLLTAPADAVVRSRLLEPGDMASAQRPVYALALTQPKWVRVYVGEPSLGKVKPGMAARVYTDSDPDQPIDGKVGYISSVAEFTPKSVQSEELRTSLVYEVRVLVDDPQDALRLGQPATVRMAVGAAQ